MNSDELHNRIKSAIALLNDGHSCKVGDLTFSCKSPNLFIVSGWLTINNLEGVNRSSALEELKEIKCLFFKMVDKSRELSEFIRDKEIEYTLNYDDSGKASIEICREVDKQIIWKSVLK